MTKKSKAAIFTAVAAVLVGGRLATNFFTSPLTQAKTREK
jgi:hypothetical protein